MVDRGTAMRALVGLVFAVGVLGYAVTRFRSHRTTSTILQVLGAGCLIMVVLTHVAEGLHAASSMGWGQPHSVGHYLDLTSAVLALGCLLAASLLWVRDRRSHGRCGRSQSTTAATVES